MRVPLQLDKTALHLHCGAQGAAGVIGGRKRRTVEGQDGIAQELVESAAMLENRCHQLVEDQVEHLHNLSSQVSFGEVGEAAQIGKKHRQAARLPAQLELAIRILQDKLGDFRVDVTIEHLAQQLVAVLKLVVHPFEAQQRRTRAT
jgi:hypothetical protein